MIVDCKVNSLPSDAHTLVLQTCFRPEHYIVRTLESLLAVGVAAWRGPRLLVADGYDPREHYDARLFHGWEVDVSAKRGRMTVTTMRAWRWALTYASDRVTHIEDDVVFARGALEYIDRAQLLPDMLLTSWFTRYAPPMPERVQPYWHVRPMAEYARLQCVTFPRSTLQAVFADPRALAWPQPNGFDNVFRTYWPEARCAIHYPNPVEHTGVNSAITEQGLQVSGQFVGENFNVRSWIP